MTKNELIRYSELKKNLMELRELLEIEKNCISSNKVREKVSSNKNNNDVVLSKVVYNERLIEIYNKKEEEFKILEKKFFDCLEKLTSKEALILLYRYDRHMTFKNISKKRYLSISRILSIHSDILKKINK